MKCKACRKAEVLDTRWDKIRLWFFKHLFRTDYEDLRADSYTQGISEGYKLGFSAGKDWNYRERELIDIMTNVKNSESD